MMWFTLPRHGRTQFRRALSLWLAVCLILGPAMPAPLAFAQVLGTSARDFGTSAPELGASGLDRRALDGIRMPPGPLPPDVAAQGGISFPVLSIASPVNGSVIRTPSPKIIITFADGRLGLDVETFQVFINGVDRTGLFEVTATGAALQVPDPAAAGGGRGQRGRGAAGLLQEGANTIVASIKNKAGLPTVVSSSFVLDTTSPVAADGRARGPIELAFAPSPSPPPALTRDAAEPGPPVISRDLVQFGYDNFSSPVSTFAPVSDAPVGPDYVLGPGDVLVAHMWGAVENTFTVPISRNGEAVFPKVGAITLVGQTFQEARRLIQQQISHYYSGYQLSVTMGSLRTVRAYLVGEVNRPGAYSLSSLSSVSNALYSGGGPSKLGSLRNIKVIRGNRTIAAIDLYDFLLKGERREDVTLQAEDTILVPPIGPVAAVTGQVKRPAIYELKGETTVADLLEMAGGVMAGASLSRVQIERVQGNDRRVLLDLDLTGFYAGRDPQANLRLRDGDLVKVFPIDNRMYNTVTLAGFVRQPGEYQLKPAMRLSALLAKDQLLPEAYLDRVEVVRLKPDWTWEVVGVDARKLFQGDATQDLELRPLDKITVGSEARGPIAVTLKGEFKVPGTYTVARGEHLSSVIARAGGYTDRAYIKGATFVRESVRKTQKERLEGFIKASETRLLAEASSLEATGVSKDEAVAERESVNQRREMLRLIASQVVPGRVVVRLDAPEKMKGGPYDVELEDGDRVEVPQAPASVLVVGSVRNPTAVTWQKDRNVDYYLDQSGGLTKEADKDEIYVIKPDGSTVASFVRVRDVEPGDVVMVPPSTEVKVRTRSVIKDIAQILGSLALGVAGIAAVAR